MKIPAVSRLVGCALVVTGILAVSGCAIFGGEKQPTVRVISGTVVIEDADGSAINVDKSTVLEPDSTVTTEGDGALAELAWPDGSFTRLAGDTHYVIRDEGSRGELLDGTIWNRVSDKAAGKYEVITPLGKISAEGTTFVVNCVATTLCIVSVVEGTVTAGGKEKLTGPAWAGFDKGFAETNPLPYDSVFGSDWAVQNAELDEKAGFPSASDLYKGQDPLLASLVGTFTGTRTVDSLECSGADCQDLPQVGDVADREYVFDIDCSGGVPCIPQVLATRGSAATNNEVQELMALTFDGDAYSWALEVNPGPYCETSYPDGTIVSEGMRDNPVSWGFVPIDAAIVDGVFTITAMEGAASASSHVTVVADNPDCSSVLREFSQEATIEVSR